MALYRDIVAPRLIDWACGATTLTPWRERVCEGLSGAVVEIGFGSGHNAPFFSSAIERVYAVEPALHARQLAIQRVTDCAVPVEFIGDEASSIPLPNSSCDAALSSFTLCSVMDPGLALSELWRVLKPKGRLHVLEHGLAPSRALALSQRLLTPVQRRLAGGCHLDRRPLELVRDAGFEFVWSEEGPASGPRPWSYFSAGVAVKC